MLFRGSSVALVTPMLENGAIDFNRLTNLVNWHILSGTQALIINGTTGEASTLSREEQCQVLKHVIAQVEKRIPVIAGTGSNATQSTIEKTLEAEQLGADGCLIVTPYYNKPTQAGLLRHFNAIAYKTSLPILLYNVPSRTACDLKPETVVELAKVPNIIGIKEATGDVARVAVLKEHIDREFLLLSGDDGSALEFILAGGDGVISVTANILPGLMSQMCQHALMGENALSKKLNEKMQMMHQVLFLESNPIPVKWLLWQMGKIDLGIRLPLTVLSTQHHDALMQALNVVGEDNV